MDAILARTAALLKNAYAPYSGCPSAAALVAEDGRAWFGVTCENAAFTDGFEGVETAIGAMVVESDWVESDALPVITDVIIVNGEDKADRLPAVVALARLRQFCTAATMIRLATPMRGFGGTHRLGDLMAYASALSFAPSVLEEKKKTRQDMRRGAGSPADDSLLRLRTAMTGAYCPVSGYSISARVTTTSGAHFYGANVETGANISMHAEALAIAAMVTALGPAARIANVTTLARGDPGFPCGDCRQKMNEFCTPRTDFTALTLAGAAQTVALAALLPYAFVVENLENGRREIVSGGK